MVKKQKRRKLDQFLHEYRKDPEVALSEMTRLSNRLWRIAVGIALTSVFIGLLYPIGDRARLIGAGDWKRLVGLGSLLFLINGVGWLVLLRIQPGIFDKPVRFNRFIFLILGAVCLSKALFLIGWSPYLAPLPILAMIMGMLFGPAVTLLVVVGVGFYLSLLSPRMWMMNIGELHAAIENHMSGTAVGDQMSITLLLYEALTRMDFMLGISLILGGAVAVLGVQRIRQQSKPALVGLLVGLTQAFVVLAFQILDPDLSYEGRESWERVTSFLENPGWALAGGIISGGFMTIFLPLVERVLGIITERRLLALSDPNNELLRTLRNRAPGTYQHTLGVAQLSSAAAEAIQADALLVQVGAYYHDIGKIVKPEYFVENMGEDKTIHSRLRPSMSKIIIISHVKEGIELAQEARLPQRIIDMIPMHHVTTVVEYFFHKAVELSNGETRESEAEYRYPGPRPRFKEAGILMLADATEAVAKTIVDPTPTRFQAMVSEIVRKRLHDGQLDQCNLTIRDLRQIEDSFVRTLTNMYHARIRYPSAEGEGAEETRERKRKGVAETATAFERDDETQSETDADADQEQLQGTGKV